MEQHLKQSSPFGLFLRLISTFWQTRTTRRKPSVWLSAMLIVAISSMLLATGGLATAKETVTYIHSDISGSPLAATDAAGNVLWKESYFAYGQKTEWQPESEAQTQWFHGKEQDADTTMQYFGARYYDPGIGRFLGIDPVDYQDGNLHSFNRYAYGNNNPTKYLDPDGRIAFLIPFALTATAHAARTVALRFAVTATVNASRVGIVAGEIAAGEALGGAALAGGAAAVGAAAAKGTTTLYRAVGPAELANINKTGAFNNIAGIEGKYFTTSAADASAYAKQAVRAFGDAPYTTVRTQVPNSVFKGLSPATVDGGIPAWVLPTDRLKGLTPTVVDNSVLPPLGF